MAPSFSYHELKQVSCPSLMLMMLEQYNILPECGTIYHRLEIRCSYFILGEQNAELVEGQRIIVTSEY